MGYCSEILNFLNKYAGKEYNNNNELEQLMGKLEHLNAKLLSNAIEMRFPEFESKTSTWQNRGKFRK